MNGERFWRHNIIREFSDDPLLPGLSLSSTGRAGT